MNTVKVRLNVSIAGAVLTLATAIVVYLAIPSCIAEMALSTDVGPRALPQLICILIAILSVIQIIMVLAGKTPAEYRELSLEKYGKPLLVIALAVITAIASNYISVVIAAAICSMLYLMILRVRNWRGYVAILITGGLLYVLMKFALHIRF